MQLGVDRDAVALISKFIKAGEHVSLQMTATPCFAMRGAVPVSFVRCLCHSQTAVKASSLLVHALRCTLG